MFAVAFHTILPDLSSEVMIVTYGIYHLAREQRGLSLRPPYRHPHHSASSILLVGGGTFPNQVKFHWRIIAFYFWMNLENFREKR